MRTASSLQSDIAAFLTALVDPVVNGAVVPIQNVNIIKAMADEEPGDGVTYDRVMRTLAGEMPRGDKFGLAIVVGRPEMTNATPNGRAVQEDAEVIIEVVEDMATNRVEATGTGVLLDDGRAVVATVLHAWSHDGKHALQYLRSDPIPEAALEAGKRGWQLTFVSRHYVNNVPDQVSRPVITDNGPTMTITCATAGAIIYYSLDGSYPSATDLYSGPVDINALSTGTLVRAAAYKDGLRPSDVAEITL